MKSRSRIQWVIVPSSTARRRMMLGTLVRTGAFAMLLSHSVAFAGNTWDGGGSDSNWGTGDNWNPNGAPGYGTISFNGTARTTNTNNTINDMNQVNWNGEAAWVMNGSATLSLFDFGGTQAKLESLGSGGVTINANITFAANNVSPPNPFGEINAVGSNMTFAAGTLTVNGSSVNGIKFFGGAGRDVTFASTVSASGKWMGFTNANGSSVTIATGANVTMGDFYVMNGNTLKLAGGTLTTSAVRLGGDFGNTGNQNQALGGTFALTTATGGLSFGGVINTVSGNTSNALLIDSQNTSGTNTLTGSLFLDSDLRTATASGGTLAFTTGDFDMKNRKLTIDGAGTTTISQVLRSSLGAGGMLVKQGSGSLILSNTSNTYTGTNNNTLNANGTQIAGGTLGIHGDGSLGLAPADAYNNIQFTASGTLQNTANNVSLNANRNISIASGATASFDSNGNTFTINGIVNGSGGNVAKVGSGTVIFSAANTYSGTTSVTAGTLLVNNTSGSGTGSGAVSVSAGTTDETAVRLGGSGTISGATIFTADPDGGAAQVGGIHSPGQNSVNGGVGKQTFTSSVTYNTGSIFEWNLAEVPSTTGRGTSYDAVNSTGLGSTTGAIFRVVLNGAQDFTAGFWDTDQTWLDIFKTSDGGSVIDIASIFSGTVQYYNGGGSTPIALGAPTAEGAFTLDGGTLKWTAVPEPTSALVGLLIGAGLLRRRRA